jgi:hypothetical protein
VLDEVTVVELVLRPNARPNEPNGRKLQELVSMDEKVQCLPDQIVAEDEVLHAVGVGANAVRQDVAEVPKGRFLEERNRVCGILLRSTRVKTRGGTAAVAAARTWVDVYVMIGSTIQKM